jgi:hypothetical protein
LKPAVRLGGRAASVMVSPTGLVRLLDLRGDEPIRPASSGSCFDLGRKRRRGHQMLVPPHE